VDYQTINEVIQLVEGLVQQVEVAAFPSSVQSSHRPIEL
jgi:hypothetical protein